MLDKCARSNKIAPHALILLCNFTKFCFSNNNKLIYSLFLQQLISWNCTNGVIFDLLLPQKQQVFRTNWSYFFKACFLPIFFTSVLIETLEILSSEQVNANNGKNEPENQAYHQNIDNAGSGSNQGIDYNFHSLKKR